MQNLVRRDYYKHIHKYIHTQAPACASIIIAIIMKVFLQHKNLIWRDYSKHAHTDTHNHPNTWVYTLLDYRQFPANLKQIMNRENQTHEVIMNTVEVGVGVGMGMGATLNTACITVLSQSVSTTFVSWNSIFNRLLIPAQAFDPVFFLLYNPLKSLWGQNKTNSHATKPRQIHTQPNQDKFTHNQTKTNSHATKPRQIHTQPNRNDPLSLMEENTA